MHARLSVIHRILLGGTMVSIASSAMAAGRPQAIAADATVFQGESSLIGRSAGNRVMTATIALPSRDPDGLTSFINRIGTKGDPEYHHYLTSKEYADRFGGDQASYNAVVAWAKSNGFTLGEKAVGRHVVILRGTAAKMEKAFGIRLNDYRAPDGHVFHAPDVAPTLPEEIASHVSGVIGLSNYTRFVPNVKRAPASKHAGNDIGTGVLGFLAPKDLRQIYNVAPPTTGVQAPVVALFEQGGFDPKDIATYNKKYNLPNVPVTVRGVDGYLGGIDDLGVEVEAVLDIDMVTALNPGVAQIIVYEDGIQFTDPNGNDMSFQTELLDSLSAMATDDLARTISISYGQDEMFQGSAAIAAENIVFKQLAAQGQSVLVSAGDAGIKDNLATPLSPNAFGVQDPCSQPYVTCVGGTTVFTIADEQRFAENVWNELLNGAGATGGGVSKVWKLPRYQSIPASSNSPLGAGPIYGYNGSPHMRNVPDIAAVADPLTGVSIYSGLNGGWGGVGGTSVAAPVWGGIISNVDAAQSGFGFGHVGFLNQVLYDYTHNPFQAYFGYPFLNVTVGDNGQTIKNGKVFSYPAVGAVYSTPEQIASGKAGYDNDTGLGTPFANTLLFDQVFDSIDQTRPGKLANPFNVVSSATSTSVTISWAAPENATGYIVYAFAGGGGPLVGFATSTTSVTIPNLTPSTTYNFTILAVNKRASSGASTGPITTQAAN